MVVVQLDNIVKLCISDHRHRSRKHCGKFECHIYVSLFQQVKMVVIAPVECQVECIQRISIIVVTALYADTLVGVVLAGARKQHL